MLVTLANMKSYLGVSGSDDDTFLTEQIGIVSEAIEAYCRRKFKEAAYVQTFYASDYGRAHTLDLAMYPVKTITSIEEDGIAYLSDSYRVQKEVGRLTRVDGFHYGTLTVVEYTAGYADADIPKLLQGVVYTIVSERYTKKKSGVNLNFGSDVQRVSIPGTISIDFDYSLSNNDRTTPFGVILGAHLNVLDYYRSDRAVLGAGKLTYVE
jgi:hypothetical protein